ncbi:hypothetical protein SAMN05216257_104177 [Meinhardsimonia xiamenensis]|jgi:uncharacterized flavoprotein (TIGR03862 family)|uniref:TIGR03862 family flavoprotein n=1 Tax=Meinhardsimonia xiamenensis TaxID=990712 RepID=A0A1G9E752_9RHOB|nr:TIGR03862 family flavoprotein [Meinhardsimonia xiamenensis]PRX33901.1 hypothetical protein LV81_02337 [Meinhardsimonia xiamenensis]SDK71908.1 hypothetical protein SAMN05216257_104177 [Meinhardsimonia xiamenensis]
MTATEREAAALVIGGGPAGLAAAEVLAEAGVPVLVAEAKPSVARKFLMAGKSGLNLTKDEPFAQFLAAYGGAAARLRPMLSAFGPEEVQRWAEDLGEALFIGSTGRVFPRAMKASPLLRRWLGRLEAGGVTLATRWRCLGRAGKAWRFATPEGEVRVRARVTVLALGGASWPRLGSDGAWAAWLGDAGVPLTPFVPSNAALRVEWSRHMARHFGAPVKGVALEAGGQRSRGEFVISAQGLEGGGIYALSAALREGAPLVLDLAPDVPLERLAGRLAAPRGKRSRASHLRKTARLEGAKLALLNEFARPLPEEPGALARLIKALPVPHLGLAGLERAISSAGGIRWEGLSEGLELLAMPGVFAAGEMLDWDAPTGGYLLTACLATRRWAGRAAAQRLTGSSR